jgi:small subunit ribosomal protein S17
VAEETENTEETTEAPAEEVVVAEADTAAAEAPDASEAAPSESDASERGAAPSAQPEPKRKKKRLPRRLRPQRTRARRPASDGKRKPIAREPKPDQERGRRQERRGVVVSDAMDKTIVVKVDVIKSHPRYKKVVRRSVKFHAHDERNEASVGDVVRIVETRPLSKTKHWRLAEVLEVAK